MRSRGQDQALAHARCVSVPPTWRRWSTLWRTLGLSYGTLPCRYGSSSLEEWDLGWQPLRKRTGSGGAGLGAGECELGWLPRRTSGRTSTPSGRWSARFGTRPRAGGSPSCPTSCGSNSPSRSTCGWVSASAPASSAKPGPRVHTRSAWVRAACESGCLIRAFDLETARSRSCEGGFLGPDSAGPHHCLALCSRVYRSHWASTVKRK